jgi:hypothetical protein
LVPWSLVAEPITSKFLFQSDWTLAGSGGARVKLQRNGFDFILKMIIHCVLCDPAIFQIDFINYRVIIKS